MGFKRPFDGEEFQGPAFKQARAPCGNKLTQFVGSVSCANDLQKPKVFGEGDYNESLTKSGEYEQLGNNSVSEDPNFANDIVSNAPITLVSSSSSDEDVGPGAGEYSSLFPEYFECDFPRRRVTQFEDVYSSYLDHLPQKQVLIGPNHQAIISPWNGNLETNSLQELDSARPNHHSFSDSNPHNCDEEKKLMGSCIIPMQDMETSADDSNKVGGGRTDCLCLDAHSVRCVRQHIMEGREALRKSVGHGNFVNLGFYDMGEEVACQWSEEEEQTFQSVVYSNPASLGLNFWKRLSEVFPTHPMKEIVSYYFNVFILRRRASQNRSNRLDIDSDDDEWHGIYTRSSFKVLEEDEDSGVESPVDLIDEDEQVGVILSDNDDDEGSEANDDSSGNSDGDQVDAIDDYGDATGEDSSVDYGLEVFDVMSDDMNRFDLIVKHVDGKTGSVEDDFVVQDDSCLSFESQTDKVDTCGPLDAGAAFTDDKHAHLKTMLNELDGHDIMESQIFLLDPCDSKLWDARFGGNIKGVDFLPTSNIIEEIFGQGTCEKTLNYHGIV